MCVILTVCKIDAMFVVQTCVLHCLIEHILESRVLSMSLLQCVHVYVAHIPAL